MTIPKFKREVTKFQGGDCPRENTATAQTDYVDERDVDIVRCVNEDADLWRVNAQDTFGSFLAYGDDMNPHPTAAPTNIELVAHLMTWGSTAFTQVFIIEAATRYANQILADEEETRRQMANHFIAPDLMISTAKEVRDCLNTRAA